ncbi:SH3 domain-containing protein [Campylobacter sputorum]|uniref:SH3 domain-containing protein n=1 Tax=Campylobacter sputorum TaxID=206 RepID=UPI00068AAE17|nr:SH3 domain-containing protein [Campylobacter sputorum]
MRFFLVSILFISTLFGEPSVFDMFNEALSKENAQKNEKDTKILDLFKSTQKDSQVDKKTQQNNQISVEEMQSVAPTDEVNLNLKDEQIYEKVEPTKINLNVSNMPKSVLQNEIFKFDVIADISDNIDISMHTDITTSSNLEILNSNFEWVDIGNAKYKAIIWAVVKSSSNTNMDLKLTLNKNGEFYQSASISPQFPKINVLNTNSNFSQIVADDLKILKYKTSHFDDKNYIMVVEARVKNGDLSLFHLNNKHIIKQGVDSIKGDYSNQSAFYFVTFDPTLKSLDFNYYNTKSKTFENFSLKVEVEGDEISTQIGLNPQESEFKFYKDLLVYSLILFFAAMFVWKRKYYMLVLSVFFMAIAIYSYNPFGKATLMVNSNVRIIPTERSTIFYISKNNESVKILGSKDDYKKILMKDGQIGWVKSEALVKN